MTHKRDLPTNYSWLIRWRCSNGVWSAVKVPDIGFIYQLSPRKSTRRDRKSHYLLQSEFVYLNYIRHYSKPSTSTRYIIRLSCKKKNDSFQTSMIAQYSFVLIQVHRLKSVLFHRAYNVINCNMNATTHTFNNSINTDVYFISFTVNRLLPRKMITCFLDSYY